MYCVCVRLRASERVGPFCVFLNCCLNWFESLEKCELGALKTTFDVPAHGLLGSPICYEVALGLPSHLRSSSISSNPGAYDTIAMKDIVEVRARRSHLELECALQRTTALC